MDYTVHTDRFRRRFAEVERNLGDPAVFNDPKKSEELGREFARLKRLVEVGDAYEKASQDLIENRELVAEEPEDSELAELAREEIMRLEAELPGLELALREGLLPTDPTDSRNTIVEIRAGAGGDESSLFAADLFRMYGRYAEGRGWKVEPLRGGRLQGDHLRGDRRERVQAA
jgi:peptide chain release factor 1